jgi:hypothetical protein
MVHIGRVALQFRLAGTAPRRAVTITPAGASEAPHTDAGAQP